MPIHAVNILRVDTSPCNQFSSSIRWWCICTGYNWDGIASPVLPVPRTVPYLTRGSRLEPSTELNILPRNGAPLGYLRRGHVCVCRARWRSVDSSREPPHVLRADFKPYRGRLGRSVVASANPTQRHVFCECWCVRVCLPRVERSQPAHVFLRCRI